MDEATQQTISHIRRVQELLAEVVAHLLQRGREHDASKLCSPEVEAFAQQTEQLRDCTYGSERYRELLREIKPAIEHHYAHNRHHPEHWPGGIKDMSLLDLLEMMVDWKAATERHADGDLEKSLVHNQERFGYGDELLSIFRRTAMELWPAHLEPWHCFACGAGSETGYFCGMCGAGKHDFDAAGAANTRQTIHQET